MAKFCDCSLKCTECRICVHSYSICTCQDYLVLVNICKHIHLTVRTIKGNHLQLQRGKGLIDHKNNTELQYLHDELAALNDNSDILQRKANARKKLQILTTILEKSQDDETVKIIDSQLQVTIGKNISPDVDR